MNFVVVDSGENKQASCKYCKLEMSGKSSSGTKHLWQHLERCNDFHSKTKQTLLKTSAGSTLSNWVFSQEKAREALIKLIIADKCPFKSVEHPLFKDLMSLIQPQFRLYGRTTIKKDFIKIY